MDLMPWYIPLLIFFARICDVSIGTVRVMLVVQGKRWSAAMLGFIEVTIWVIAVREALFHLPNPFAVFGFAGGFACGTLIGMMIEDKLAFGYRAVRIISTDSEVDLARVLREEGYRVTKITGYGRDGPVDVVFLVLRRRGVRELMERVNKAAPKAFVTVERVEPPKGRGFDSRAAGLPGSLTGGLRK